MKEKLLIANRGEIACRIIKTCKKLGIATVAIYSDADTNSLFVREADESYHIGESPSSKSYLDIGKVINVAKKTGSTLVHPGYGFLSENCNFAKELENNNITFIGPSEFSIKCMGDKIESKKIAIKAGVSTVPGHMGIVADANEAKKISKEIGFPVMIKASSGGGGKGMRIVYNENEVADAFESASNEARNSFSDDRIFIEKFIEKPHHIEIQIIADKHGNVVCLGERECSIQRNNQKVIEESPSPFLTQEVREKMYKQSISLAKKVKYHSAGTVEYIMDKDRNFYFLEMNTRLQVEHPVTELVTGLDLVELMIEVAQGQKLSFTQNDVKLKGCAIESRIYAEDPSRGFLPSSGRISQYSEPKGKNIRVDTGVYEGAGVSMFYDAMIAKLCSYGNNRKQAVEVMKNALSSFAIDGISHNINFLEAIMKNKKFIDGDLTTNFIKEEFPEGFSGAILDSEDKINLISASLFIFFRNFIRNSFISGRINNREKQVSDRWVVDVNEELFVVDVLKKEKNYYELTCNGKNFSVKSSWQNGQKIFICTVNDLPVHIKIKKNNLTGDYLFQYAGSDTYVSVLSPRIAELKKFMPKIEKNPKPKKLKSPITGKIVKFKAKQGELVKAGQELVSIEAMKMENIIRSDHDVVIEKIHFNDGDNVGVGQVVMDFKN
jgi:propionyl-CoA carboxylase alpha chain